MKWIHDKRNTQMDMFMLHDNIINDDRIQNI